MKTVLYFLAVLLFISTHTYPQGITPLTNLPTTKFKVSIVDITTAWNNTGITIQQNDTIVIFCQGVAAANGAFYPNSILWGGPEGVGNNAWLPTNPPCPTASAFSVIGKIGDGGQAFYVGRNCAFIANVTGNLFLGLNDTQFGDNFGYYIAFITKRNLVDGFGDEFGSNDLNNYTLSQNYPNPFNPTTSIQFNNPGASNIKITVYDINGQIIKNLINEFRDSGNYTVSWDGKDNSGTLVSTGTYYYQIQIGNFVQTKKMILLK